MLFLYQAQGFSHNSKDIHILKSGDFGRFMPYLAEEALLGFWKVKPNGNRSTHVVPNARSLRLRIKPRISQAKFAIEAHVSADTLRKVEAGEAVTEAVATDIFDALKKRLGNLSQLEVQMSTLKH